MKKYLLLLSFLPLFIISCGGDTSSPSSDFGGTLIFSGTDAASIITGPSFSPSLPFKNVSVMTGTTFKTILWVQSTSTGSTSVSYDETTDATGTWSNLSVLSFNASGTTSNSWFDFSTFNTPIANVSHNAAAKVVTFSNTTINSATGSLVLNGTLAYQ